MKAVGRTTSKVSKMKKQIIQQLFSIFFLGLLITFSACHSHEDGHEHDEHGNHIEAEDGHSHGEDDHAHEEESDDEVGLTQEQMEKINLQLGSFEQKNLRSTLKVSGKLELPPQNKANVSSITSGKITNIAVQPGQYVKKGQRLATIYNPEMINWQQEYLEVKGQLLFLDKEYDRQKDLVAKEIAPQKQFDKITSERAIAQAKLAGLASKMKTLSIPIPESSSSEFKTLLAITSPLSGFVRAININTGTFVNPQQELFEIVDNHHLHIDFSVFEKDLPYVKEGQIINFNLQSQPKVVMQSKIFAIGKALQEKDRSISIHAEIIDEKKELIPGMYVEGRIVLDDQKVAALPEEAITMDKGLSYIFIKTDVHDEETHFKKIPVLKGTTDLGFVEVTPMEPLAANTAIVTEGAYFLMAQTKKGEEGGGHSHGH